MHFQLSTDCRCYRRKNPSPLQKFTNDKLHENACQKLRPDSLKMHQKAFGGRALPGPGPLGELFI